VKNVDAVSRVHVGHRWIIGMRREAESQAALQRFGRPVIIHAAELDFVTVAPRQPSRFIAQSSIPSQRRMQIELVAIDEPHNVIRGQGLLRNPGAENAKRDPSKK
jgi:hypothetical protein